MKLSKLLVASSVALFFGMISCKKESTTPTTTPSVVTNASYDITIDTAKYLWNGNASGVSTDSNFVSVIFQDSLTKKFILALEYEKDGSSDTSVFTLACQMNKLGTATFTKSSSDTVFALRMFKTLDLNLSPNFIYSSYAYFQNNMSITFANSYTTTPKVGTIISGNISGSMRGIDMTKVMFGDTTSFVHNIKTSFNAVYKGMMNLDK